MAASVQSAQDTRDPFSFPDGKQTRIDFFESGKRSSRDWWHALTGWLRASRHEQEDRLSEYRAFLEDRGYSPKTCQSYIFMLRKFFRYLDEQGTSQITFGDIEDYNYAFFVSGKYSRSYQLQFINGLSLYLEYDQGVRVNLKGLQRSEARR